MSLGHAKLSPSSADRWYNCPASMIPDVPVKDDGNVHAARGTALHAIGEKLLLGEDITTEDLHPVIDGFEIHLTADDVQQAEDYAEYIVNGRTFGDVLCVEEKLHMDSFIPEGSGTADAQLIEPLSSVEVIDAKFGSGKMVMASSLQIIIYMIASWDRYAIEHMLEYVEGTIVQPPFDHVDTTRLYPEEVEEWREKIRLRADIAWKHSKIDPKNKKAISGAEHLPGEHCNYCPRKLKCLALKSAVSKAAKADFDDIVPSAEDDPDANELAKMKALVGPLEGWIKAINAEVSDRLKKGKQVPGWKLVAGRKSRKWTDDEEIEKYLRSKKVKVSEFLDTKLKSVAQMEKALKDNDRVELVEYIVSTPGRPTIAPESDRRRAISSEATMAFTEDL